MSRRSAPLRSPLQSPLGRARGLGPAKNDAVGPWMAQRLTAVALVPLSLWFVFQGILCNLGATHAEMVGFFSQPLNAALMLMTVLFAFYHGTLGMVVILEDYIQSHALRTAAITAVKLYAALGALVASVSILKLSVGG